MTPLDSIKHTVQHELMQTCKYRKKILRKLKTFGTSLSHIQLHLVFIRTHSHLLTSDSTAGMSELLLQAIAESMEELQVRQGYVIIEQGERGDAFYVLKEGTASVTVSP